MLFAKRKALFPGLLQKGLLLLLTFREKKNLAGCRLIYTLQFHSGGNTDEIYR